MRQNLSNSGGTILKLFSLLYDIARSAQGLDAELRHQLRQLQGRPAADILHTWLSAQRIRVLDGSATARTIDYILGRWGPLTRYLDDGDVPIDNNWAGNRILPIALGRNNWLFAGSLRTGQRAAAIMSLIQSAKLNEHDAFRVHERHS